MIHSTGNQHHHWNYFLAIEKDVETLSRYIEFTEANYDTYSVELAHILLSASSEVDVVLKQICRVLGIQLEKENIEHYRDAIMASAIGQRFANEEISIGRYDVRYKPYENWNTRDNMNWWSAYNKVKHVRNDNFDRASLRNALNAVGALLIAVVYFYKLEFSARSEKDISFADVIATLSPMSSLLDIAGDDFIVAIMRVR